MPYSKPYIPKNIVNNIWHTILTTACIGTMNQNGFKTFALCNTMEKVSVHTLSKKYKQNKKISKIEAFKVVFFTKILKINGAAMYNIIEKHSISIIPIGIYLIKSRLICSKSFLLIHSLTIGHNAYIIE